MKRTVLSIILCVAATAVVVGQNDTMPVVDSILKNEKIIPLQFGLIHPLSSNGKDNLEVYNKVSINILSGQSKGVVGTEVSVIHSENSAHAIGFKGTGIADIVHGSMQGFQAAGIMAAVGGSTHGFQAGGILAITEKNFDGFQAAGIVSNTDGKFKGFQAGGIIAAAGDSVDGMQAAGIVSICKAEMKGLQIGGILSLARYANGVQIGLINIADSIDPTTVQIGLLNIVRKGGIRRYGVMNTEFMSAALFLKSGTRFFHGYVGIGARPGSNGDYFAPMIGAGTSIRLANRIYFEPEWMQWFVNQSGRFLYNERASQVQQLRAVFSFSAGRRGPHISAGPTINLAYSSYLNTATGERGIDFAPNYFYNKTSSGNNVNVRAWIGYTVAVSMGR